ncbi:MAG: DNA topoisomerase IV subunit A [Parvularculales bacterium]
MPDMLSLATGGEEDVLFREALEERYLTYALSTIMHRSLPDVRDGLKPVHRRLVYAMSQLRLNSNSGFKKSARIVGDVIGRYHPHGDQAVYDALVRLAQDFAARYPLIDGQGNFGNVDGDRAAAMRYTESRLTPVADALLEGIDEDAVDFRETYDGEDREPVVLPANFPNLLANGASGIAVGMATSIPPHNVSELCAGALHLIKHPAAGVAKLNEFIPAPDFPTGGIVVEDPASILDAYKTGRGGVRLRARWELENRGREKYQIVITEIPWQVNKARLVEKLADIIQERKLVALADVRDESSEDVRLVLEPRSRSVDPYGLMEALFRMTDLETRIPINMNVLVEGQVPTVVTLKQALQAWLDHRREVLLRRVRFRLGKIDHRIEVLEGYLVAYLNLDKVIRIIREEDNPAKKLMAAFKLTSVQAEAILNMRLRSLRKLEEKEIKTEHKALIEERRELRKLLKSKDGQWKHITGEVRRLRDEYDPKTEHGRRRSEMAEAPEVEDITTLEQGEAEPITIVCSEKGWIRALRGHVESDAVSRFKEGDELKFLIHGSTQDNLLLFATNGRFYTLAADRLPGGRGHGEPVRLMFDMEEDHSLVTLFVHKPGRELLVASRAGYGFVVPEDETLSQRRAGKQILNLGKEDRAAACSKATGDHAAVIGEKGKMLIFPADELPVMNRGRGVKLQRYREGGLQDVCMFTFKEGLEVAAGSGRRRVFDDLKDWVGKRGQAGRLPPRGFPRDRRFGLTLDAG